MKFIEANIPIPKDCFLHKLTKLHGQQVCKDEKGRFYTWDRLHGHIEKFSKTGKHLGILDAITGKIIDDIVVGRRLKI